MRGIVNDVIGQFLKSTTRFSSTEVSKAAGISRQAAHKRLRQLVASGSLLVEGKARAARYVRAVPVALPVPLRTRLEVATAGSQFRLSARLLLDGVEAGEVTLDFTGVVDVGEEFLEEVFLVWAPKHPRVSFRVAHLPARFAPLLMGLAMAQLGKAREAEQGPRSAGV